MADEALFLLLHNEMVSGVYKSAEQGEVENGRCITKLENMGFRVGQGLIERFTKDTARFKDELDIMKFICKDFWTTVFKKQIDNLRTNHQGIYVLQDNKFRLLTQMSAGKQYLEHASKYLAFTCGLIRGGLSNLGIKSIVTAEVSSMPACSGVHVQNMQDCCTGTYKAMWFAASIPHHLYLAFLPCYPSQLLPLPCPSLIPPQQTPVCDAPLPVSMCSHCSTSAYE
uniref:Trafficking protein particle complex subunit 6B n=1 Tax=Callithrix jacchus TaxID=9483 RepID=A0A8I3VVG1_CALJA